MDRPKNIVLLSFPRSTLGPEREGLDHEAGQGTVPFPIRPLGDVDNASG